LVSSLPVASKWVVLNRTQAAAFASPGAKAPTMATAKTAAKTTPKNLDMKKPPEAMTNVGRP
jgi:hypothetical protein